MTAVCKLERFENQPPALVGRESRFDRQRLLRILKNCWWWWRQVTGDAAYENYVRRVMQGSPEHAACGPCKARGILSAEQFYVARLRREHTGINRCC